MDDRVAVAAARALLRVDFLTQGIFLFFLFYLRECVYKLLVKDCK